MSSHVEVSPRSWIAARFSAEELGQLARAKAVSGCGGDGCSGDGGGCTVGCTGCAGDGGGDGDSRRSVGERIARRFK